METLMAESLAKTKPTDPLRLAKQARAGNETHQTPQGISLARALAPRWARKESKRIKSCYKRPEVLTAIGIKTMGSVLGGLCHRLCATDCGRTESGSIEGDPRMIIMRPTI